MNIFDISIALYSTIVVGYSWYLVLTDEDYDCDVVENTNKYIHSPNNKILYGIRNKYIIFINKYMEILDNYSRNNRTKFVKTIHVPCDDHPNKIENIHLYENFNYSEFVTWRKQNNILPRMKILDPIGYLYFVDENGNVKQSENYNIN